jgi:hypothetical protein
VLPDALTLTDRVSWAPQHLATEVNGTIILMSVDQGVYCGLDTIGSDVWRRLAQPTTIGMLCDAMAADYKGDRGQITADILDLLTSLRDQRLIDVTRP